MKKISKKVLSLILAVIMAFGALPFVAFANENISSDEDVSFAGGTGLNGIVNALSSAEDNEDYSITDLEIKSKTATVTLTNKDECTLIVAIYDENSKQLLATGIEEITANIGVAEVTIDITAMPEKYLSKAFLLDSGFAPLCKEYIDYSHTNAYLEFLEKEPEDFKGDEVIVFDETKEQTDFAVLSDSVTVSESATGMTFSYDESTKTYTFKNALDDVKNLSVGDVYYWKYGTQSYEFLLFKVKSITKSGSTVKVVEDQEIALSEAFEFVRIDADGDYSDVEINEDELGSALSLEPTVSVQDSTDEKPASFSSVFKLDYTAKKNQSGSVSASISGTVLFTFTAYIKFVYDVELFEEDYFEFKAETKTTIGLKGIKVEGTISLPESVSKIKTTPIPVGGVFILTPIVHLIAELSVSVSFNITYESTTTVTADSDNGFKESSRSDSDWDVNVDGELEIKVGAGIEFEISFSKIVNLSLRADCGVMYTGNATTVGAWVDKLHDCYACYYGDVYFFITGTLSLQIKIIPNVLDLKWDMVKLSGSIKMFDFHISLSAKGFSCGKGECENVWHPVTVNVTANNSGLHEKISGATVSTSTGKCDADNDGKYDENSIETDEDGNAILYFPTGENHKITVRADGYKAVEKSFSVNKQEKYISVFLIYRNNGNNEGNNPDNETVDNPNLEIVDGYIYFGSYPQSKVTDSTLLSALNAKSKTWISYGYYSGTGEYDDGQMTAKDYMKYADVTHNGNKYRAVTFSSYRPYYTGYESSSSYTFQEANDYYTNTTYWFKYEPLKWRVLDSTGLAICETIIDSQPYNNYCLYAGGEYYGNSSKTYYVNNYANSSIREWLNDDFYNTAFTSTEKNKIKTTTLDNRAYSSSYSEYDSVSTNDKVFLLSYDEARNTNYFENSAARQAKGSDYAKCQGLWAYSSNKCSGWHLRSAGYNSYGTCLVDYDGGMNYYYFTGYTYYGIRPALCLNLQTDNNPDDETGDNSNIEIVDGYIYFGSYPQSKVTDSTLLSALNAKSKTWVSYGYYSGTGSSSDGQMTAKDYMKYADVTYNGNKYRAVTFSSYRPYYTGYESSSSYTFQEANDYYTNTTYWFKYEPLKWRVLDSTGLVICETIIDSQPYNNYALYANGEWYGNSSKTYYANYYANSSIREWLNVDFYNTAFTTAQKSQIKTTTLDNSAYSSSCSKYDSVSTNDKVFLLSYNEASDNFINTPARQASGSDYAKCQGLYAHSSTKLSYWLLRSAGGFSSHTCYINDSGAIYDFCQTTTTHYGIRPALKLNLQSGISQSSEVATVQESTSTVAVAAADDSIGYSFKDCVPGNSYILMNVKNYSESFTLTEENLYFIDQVIADKNGEIKGSFMPKINDPNSTTLIFGNFKPCEIKITNAPTKTDYKKTFSLSLLWENETGDETVTWTSSNEEVLKVDENGNVTAVGKGTATITATVDGTNISDSVTVTVKYTWWQWIIVILLFGWIWY